MLGLSVVGCGLPRGSRVDNQAPKAGVDQRQASDSHKFTRAKEKRTAGMGVVTNSIEILDHDLVPRTLVDLDEAPKRASDAATRALSTIQILRSWLGDLHGLDRAKLGNWYEDEGFDGIDLSRAPVKPIQASELWTGHIHARLPPQGWTLGPLILELDHLQNTSRSTFLVERRNEWGVTLGWWTQSRALAGQNERAKIRWEMIGPRIQAPFDTQPLAVVPARFSNLGEISALYLFRAEPPAKFVDPEDPTIGPKSWVFGVFLGEGSELVVQFSGYDTELGLEAAASHEGDASLLLSGYNAGASVRYRVRRKNSGLSLEWLFDDCCVEDVLPVWGRFAWLPTGTHKPIPVFSLLEKESETAPHDAKGPVAQLVF